MRAAPFGEIQSIHDCIDWQTDKHRDSILKATSSHIHPIDKYEKTTFEGILKHFKHQGLKMFVLFKCTFFSGHFFGGHHNYIYIANLRTYIHTCMHACIHTYIHTYMHACMHAYIHTSIHTSIHTYIHTYIHAFMAFSNGLGMGIVILFLLVSMFVLSYLAVDMAKADG